MPMEIIEIPVYITNKIKMVKLLKMKPVPTYQTKAGINELFEMMNYDMSPENISCDGECSKTEVARKAREIRAAWKFCERISGTKREMEY
jgi:hypothetical protein